MRPSCHGYRFPASTGARMTRPSSSLSARSQFDKLWKPAPVLPWALREPASRTHRRPWALHHRNVTAMVTANRAR